MAEEAKQSKKDLLIQFIKFGAVGVTNTVVYWGVNVGTLQLLKIGGLFPDINFVIANMAAFIISVLWSFYWNNRLVFDMKESSKKELLAALLKMYLAYAFTGIILNNIISFICIRKLHISEYIVPLINSAIGVPINFILNKFWAFQGG